MKAKDLAALRETAQVFANWLKIADTKSDMIVAECLIAAMQRILDKGD